MNTPPQPYPPQGTGSPADTPTAPDQYRTLVDHMQQGFCIIEVLFEQTGQPLDYRFLEVNPAFEQLTGLVGVVGKTMRALQPEYEQHWGKALVVVALSGYGQEEDRQQTQATGFNGHLVKPVDLDTLTGLLSSLLKKGATSSGAD